MLLKPQKDPAGAAVHELEDVGLKDPAVHARGAAEPTVLKHPAGQGKASEIASMPRGQ